jgi:glucan-binding YG repeat protein
MENIEQVRKVEMLAKELMKHGLASNMDDAVSQAEKATRSKTEVKIPRANPNAQDSKMTDIQNNEDFRRLSLQVNQQKSMITEMQSKMNEMIGEINRFEKKMNDFLDNASKVQYSAPAPVQAAPVQAPVQEAQQQAPSQYQQPAPQQQYQQQVQQPRPAPQPDSRGIIASTGEKKGVGATAEVRTGQFKPGDFSISKIFYSGPAANKKP